MWDTAKYPNIELMGVLDGKKTENGAEGIHDEITTKSCHI